MSNRFKQSLEQTQNRVEDKAAPNVEKTPKQVDIKPVAAPVPDIFTDKTPKKRGRDISIYLSNEVWEAVSKLSEQLDVSKSTIVDRSLRQVLQIQ